MNYSNNNDSKKLLNSVSYIIEKCNIKPYKKSINSKSLEILYDLYEELKNVQYTLNHKYSNIERVVNNINIDRNIKEDLNSRFVSDEIKNYILNKSRHQIEYKFTDVIVFKICLTVYRDLDQEYLDYLDMCACNIFCILKFLYKYKSKACIIEELKLFIFLTDFRKELPVSKNSIIGPKNINSGSTRPCQKITNILIFREEEFMKLVVHESIHALGIDIPYRYNSYYTQKLDKLFGLESTYNLNETYTEIWALIINVLMIILQSDNYNRDKNHIKKLIVKCIFIETCFSRIQVIKILNFMSLSLIDLIYKTKNNYYREDTHVFAYHILKYMLLENLDDFLNICHEKNNYIINFSKIDGYNTDTIDRLKLDKFLNLIISLIKDKEFVENFSNNENYLTLDKCSEYKGIIKKTLRMTVLELM